MINVIIVVFLILAFAYLYLGEFIAKKIKKLKAKK